MDFKKMLGTTASSSPFKKKRQLHRKFTRIAVAYVLGCHENVNST